MKISLKELAEATGGKILFGDPELTFSNITTSSLLIKGEDLFVPVKGEKTDGHRYIGSAFENGASCSLTDREDVYEGIRAFESTKGLVLCEDSVRALQRFGAYFRKKYAVIPYVGITGSVGKTTTREITAKALSSCFKVYTTKGNANSQVGVPITVFETDENAEIGVIELGISEFGEMERISDLASVDTACITNIGISHIAQFGTQENILREKLGIIKNFADGGTLFVNGDDPILRELTEEKIHAYGLCVGKKVQVKYFGTGENAHIRAVNIRKNGGPVSFDAVFTETGKTVPVALSVCGDHMMMNALCALSVCDLYGVDLLKAAEALHEFVNFDGRGNRVTKDGIDYINDSYNASPVSMKAGLSVLKDMDCAGRKIAVLADMKELGENEKIYHEEIGEYILRSVPELSALYTYGELAALIAGKVAEGGTGMTVKKFSDFEDLKETLSKDLRKGDLCFLKGSNSMGLKRILS